MSEPVTLRTELEEGATAEEILWFALHRARQERDEQAAEAEECRGALDYAVEMYRQADVAVGALETLLASAEFKSGLQPPAAELSAEIGQSAPQAVAQPTAPVETIDWRQARYPGGPILAALDQLSETVEIEAPQPVAHSQPHILPAVSEIEPAALAQPEPIFEPVCQPSAPVSAAARNQPLTVPQRIGAQIMDVAPALLASHPEGVLIAEIIKATGASYNQTTIALAELHKAGKIAWVRFSVGDKYKCMRPAGSAEPEIGLTPHQELIFGLLWKASTDGVAAIDRPALRQDSGLQMATIDLAVGALRKKGFTEWTAPPAHDIKRAYYRLLRPPPLGAQAEERTPPLPKPIPAPAPVLRAPERSFGREDPELLKPELPRSYRDAQRPATKLRDSTVPACPMVVAPASDQALVIPVEFDEPDMAAWWPPNSLLALKAQNCRWPVNNPPAGQGHLTKFCSEMTAGEGPYCPAHSQAARA